MENEWARGKGKVDHFVPPVPMGFGDLDRRRLGVVRIIPRQAVPFFFFFFLLAIC